MAWSGLASTAVQQGTTLACSLSLARSLAARSRSIALRREQLFALGHMSSSPLLGRKKIVAPTPGGVGYVDSAESNFGHPGLQV